MTSPGIPNELWPILFSHCTVYLPSYRDNPTKEASRDSRNSAITLSSVCRSWREIACNTPDLWSTCWVNFVHPELNTLWLRRAGSRALHIYGTYDKYLPSDYDWDRFFDSILPFQKRWKVFDVAIAKLGKMENSPKFETYALETLKIPKHSGMHHWIRVEDIISSSPRLRHLELDSFMWRKRLYPSVQGGLKLPPLTTMMWVNAQLGATAAEVTLVLSLLPQLQHLSVYSDDWVDNSHPRNVTHSNLLSLHLLGNWLEEGSVLLDSITLPSLSTFRMPMGFAMDSFLNFVHRSGCRIAELYVGRHETWTDEIIATLHHNSIQPWVKTLHVPVHVSTDPSPAYLTSLDYPYFPHLTQLFINGFMFPHIPDGTIADLIMSRRRPRVCKCNVCRDDQQTAREIHLEYVLFDGIDPVIHHLDIARLVPLPGDRAVDSKDVSLVIELRITPVVWAVALHPVLAQSHILLRKFGIGRFSSSSTGGNDL